MPILASDLLSQQNQVLTGIGPSGIRQFDQEISNIPGIIKLTLGEPDLDTPEHIKQAIVRSVLRNQSHYSAPKGTLSLRQSISDYLQNKIDQNYDPKTEILVTVGATEALAATIIALINPGDEVILPTPAFALYFPLLQLVGAKIITLDTSENDFQLTPTILEKVISQHPAAKFIILNYPNNPTGLDLNAQTLRYLAKLIAQSQIGVIADEIYSELVYEQQHDSIAHYIPERTVLINGLSKSHAMTGYRAGYLAAPAPWVQAISKVHGFLVTCPPNPSQAGAQEALDAGASDVIKERSIYRQRRDYLEDKLRQLHFTPLHPQGAFYLFAKIPSQFGIDDISFVKQLAQKARVGIIAGQAFGTSGKGYVRFSYAASDALLQQAIQRIKYFLQEEQVL